MKPVRVLFLLAALGAAASPQTIAGLFAQAASPAPGAAAAAGPFDALHFRQIGPASMSGRIADLAVYEPNPAIYYVGTAHGGVWKTTNGGTTFDAQFQDQGLISIGDVTVSQSNPDLVWVGTGESNNRQSTSWGDGVYKSIDGGKTWTHMGLPTSRYINRIVIDPRNNDIVFVASTGSLWGPGGERGIYKTIDGGRNWKQVLKVDDETGANDLVMDAANNRILYASSYQRRRTPCCMNGGGPGSGIWKSIDGGDTWVRLKGNGLPDGPLGRIGLDVSRRRPNILYALIEGPVPSPGRGGTPDETPQVGRGAETATTVTPATATGLYRSDDAGASWKKLNDENPRPMYFSQVRIDPNDPDIIIYGGVKLHYSTDGGRTVTLNATRTIHDDVHAIWINPANSQHVIIGNDGGVAVSWDQTRTWNFIPNLPVGLFYHVSVDNQTPFNLCGGMQDNYVWCGPSQVRGSAGIAGFHWTTMQGGDGFVALQDPNDFRTAYSESQDGNMVRIDRVTGETVSMRPVAPSGEQPYRWNWDTPFILSPHNPSILFAGSNRVFRSSNHGQTWEAVGGDLTTNANREEVVTMGLKGSDISIAKNDGIVAWGTVISLAESPKRPNLLYAGTDDGNVQVARDGKQWVNVTANIPNLPKGLWVSEVAPSRFDEGTVYATFDGHRSNDFETYIYASKDFGQTWQPANGNLKGQAVKTITEDLKNPDVLYIGTETGLFVSTDRAKTWTRVKANLPTVRIDEIVLHPRDNAMVLATHGRALWVLDHIEPFQEYAAVQAAADAKLFSPPPYAMYRRPARDRNYEFWGDQAFYGENPPAAAVISWFNKKTVGDVKLKITDAAGKDVREIAGPLLAKSTGAGIQTACWDLRVQPAPAPPPAGRGRGRGEPQATTTEDQTVSPPGGRQAAEPPAAPQNPEPSPFGAGCGAPGGFGGGGGFGGPGGNTNGPFVLSGAYKVSLIVDGKTVDTRPLRVTDDPDVVLTAVEKKRMFDQAMEVHALQARVTDAATAHRSLSQQVNDLSTAVASRNDVPADVKSAVDALKKDLDALAPKLAIPQGGRGGGGGRGAANDSLLARIGLAKNGLMAGMTPGEQTTTAYADVRTQAPKVIADLNAAIAKATTVASSVKAYNFTLTVPEPVKTDAAPARRSTNGARG